MYWFHTLWVSQNQSILLNLLVSQNLYLSDISYSLMTSYYLISSSLSSLSALDIHEQQKLICIMLAMFSGAVHYSYTNGILRTEYSVCSYSPTFTLISFASCGGGAILTLKLKLTRETLCVSTRCFYTNIKGCCVCTVYHSLVF